MSKAKAIGIAIAAATAVAVPVAQKWEGFRGSAYFDPANILTQCYGETRDVDPSRIYSKDECADKLRKRMARDYAPALIECVPMFISLRHTNQFGALLDASYNAGPAAACRSPMARAFRAGKWKEGCDAFDGWYVTARNRKTGVRVRYRGLVNRRLDEAALCRRGL